MNAPRPSFTPSRLNVGGYGVRVSVGNLGKQAGRWAEPCIIPDELEAAIEFWMTTPYTTVSKRVSNGTASADGSLTLTPEAWHVRHYRRAVMRGAGVYQAGLWAYLGARRALTFTVSEAGRGVLPHRVKVRGLERVTSDVWQKMGGDVAALEVLGVHLTLPYVDAGSVNTSGVLSLAGGRQRAVYYRQSCMRGAGVYQMGLWAMLAHRPQGHAQAEGRAALGGNDGGTLARFTLAHRPPHIPDCVYLPANPGEPTFRQIRARYGEQVSQAVASAAMRGGLELLDRSGLRQILIDAFSTPVIDPEYRKRIEALASGVNDEISAALNVQAGQIKERAQRRAFRRAAREVLRLLGRMAARRVPQRPPMRVPRPLYARAVPPAAPLAPAAL